MILDIVREKQAFKNFVSDFDRGLLSHAYIVFSQDEEIRSSFVKLCEMKILCKNNMCGECPTCMQILEDSHLEISQIDGSKNPKVAEIEEIIEDLDARPQFGDKKIVYIESANLLSANIQNRLLKVFEEPHEYVVFFLAAGQEEGILPTILSRGNKIYIDRLSQEEIVETLLQDEFTTREDAELAASISMGSLAKAKMFCVDEDYRNHFNQVLDMMLNLKKSSQVPEIVYSDLFAKENVKNTLDFMQIVLYDILKIKSESKIDRSILGKEYDMNEMAKTYSVTSVSEAIFIIEKARKDLQVNIVGRSIGENVLMGILEAKYLWK